jgi:RND family efflux transporter MFP subunit
VQAARAALDVATREVERQRKLYEKKYISQSALERAEAQFRATSAQVKAQVAQASAAGIESGFYVVKAPYAGIVSEVPVQLGDMALPGRPLLTMYDPSALRVTASVPQSAIARIATGQPVRVELPGMPAAQQWLTRPKLQVLPVIDAGTHSAQVRVDLPAGLTSLAPGMFARVWLATGAATDGAAAKTGRLFVPATAVVRRAEMTGLYVLDAKGRPLLRQVRLGRATNGAVEVLSGLAAGERVALNPQAAAKGRP